MTNSRRSGIFFVNLIDWSLAWLVGYKNYSVGRCLSPTTNKQSVGRWTTYTVGSVVEIATKFPQIQIYAAMWRCTHRVAAARGEGGGEWVLEAHVLF